MVLSLAARRTAACILGLAAAHFVLATAVAFLAYGSDLDRLRSRSTSSRVAGGLYDFLWYPHDAILRALPVGAVTRPGVVPVLLVGSSLLWGVALLVLWRGVRALRSA